MPRNYVPKQGNSLSFDSHFHQTWSETVPNHALPRKKKKRSSTITTNFTDNSCITTICSTKQVFQQEELLLLVKLD